MMEPEPVAPQEGIMDTLKNKLPAMYGDFIKTYTAWKMHPENVEYQRAFENIKMNLKTEEHALRAENEKAAAMAAREHTQNAYLASKTRVTDTHQLYVETLWTNIVLGIAFLFLARFALSTSSYQLTPPPLGGGVAGFVVYLVIIILYIRYYGTSGYVFLFMIIPFFIFAVALFLKPTTPTTV